MPQIEIADAPGLCWRPRANGRCAAYWIANKDHPGFRPRTVALGTYASAPDQADVAYIRQQCQRLQGEMIAWTRGITAPLACDGTLGSLIACYRKDANSGYQNLRWESRREYDKNLNALELTVGKRALAAVKGREFAEWHKAWAEGGHVRRARGRIEILRVVLRFGIAFEYAQADCIRLSAAIGAQKFKRTRNRAIIITREQVTALRRAAHELGYHSIALAEAFRWDLMLRPKDVFGEWVPVSEPGTSGVVDGLRKWLCGIDWREISPDLVLVHRISKSLHGRDALADPDAGLTKTFNLRLYPMIMEELALIPRGISGPLIVSESTGLPYSQSWLSRIWRSCARKAGIPDHVQPRDARAGAATEAEELTGDRMLVQKALGHRDIDTTAIYVRDGDRATATVAEFRARKKE